MFNDFSQKTNIYGLTIFWTLSDAVLGSFAIAVHKRMYQLGRMLLMLPHGDGSCPNREVFDSTF
jgi:hypothetical protein